MVPIQLDIALALPVKIQIKLNTLDSRLVDVYIGKLDRDMPKVEFDEMQTREWTRKC
jgi:hypothetical protein